MVLHKLTLAIVGVVMKPPSLQSGSPPRLALGYTHLLCLKHIIHKYTCTCTYM